MQCASTILSSMAWPALWYFSILSHKWHNFRKKVIEHKMRVLIFSIIFICKIFHSKKNWMRYGHKCTCLHVKYPLFLSGINETWIFSIDFWKIPKYQISWKTIQGELSCSMCRDRWTDRQTDMTMLTGAFGNFANAPNNGDESH